MKRLLPPPPSAYHSLSAGILHCPNKEPLAAFIACISPISDLSIKTKPPGMIWGDPEETFPRFSCIAHSGTRSCALLACRRSCTTRPDDVPTTTHPTSAGSKACSAGCSSCCSQSGFTANDSIVSWSCSNHEPDIFHSLSGLTTARSGIGPQTSGVESALLRVSGGNSVPQEVYRGHSVRRR